MYKCFECGAVFDTPTRYVEDCTPGGVFEGGQFLSSHMGCPYCAEAYGSVEECCDCGEIVYVDEGSYTEDGFICDDCQNNKTEEMR